MNVMLVLQIAGLGLLMASLNTILKQSGKEEYAFWANVAGFVGVAVLVIRLVNNLFDAARSVFRLY